jgi:hypothetical protein
MPPFILAAAGVLGAVALVRFLAREGQRVNRELDDVRKANVEDTGGVPTLQRDPETGAYRPK